MILLYLGGINVNKIQLGICCPEIYEGEMNCFVYKSSLYILLLY